MLLDQGSVESLLQSSGVVYKAGRDVLSLTKPEDFAHPVVTVEWLNMTMAPRVSAAMPSRQMGMDREMMRQMEEIYGRDYVRQMNGAPDQEKKDGAKEDRSGESPQRDGASNPSRPNRSDDDRIGKGSSGAYGAAAGGAVGGMGGMGMGGAALSGQEPSMNSSRLPGETDVAYRTRLAQARAQQKALQAMRNRGMGMGGMGGMSGGMMGGAGGMGGMVGAMGGYGGGGGMGFFGAPALSPHEASGERSATVRLSVNLPEDVPPLADEFLSAVVRNLQDSLSQAYEAYFRNLQEWLSSAQNQRRTVEAALEGAADDPATAQEVRRRLNTTVDLSALNPQMPLKDAVALLKKSVEPPLNIVVLWNNLSHFLQVEPTTPVNIDGMASVRLRTALDLLVRGIPNRMGLAGPIWKIKDDVIVIGTAVALMEAGESAAKPKVEADAVNLAGERSELARRVQALELDVAGMDARRDAVAAQIAGVRQRVNEKLSQDAVVQELQKLAKIQSTTVGKDAEGRPVYRDSSDSERAIRARIELANRREELSKQVGGGQLEEFNKELSRMAIDKAEKEAQLQIVRRQLDEVQKQLAQALAFDPEVARLRLAREALDITGGRVAELQARMANLQPPMVTMIGAN
jgi:hypothetical protein